MTTMYDVCTRMGCQQRAKGQRGCLDACIAASLAKLECLPVLPPAPSRAGNADRVMVRPRNSAGVAYMARLMQRAKDDRDFGGAVDE